METTTNQTIIESLRNSMTACREAGRVAMEAGKNLEQRSLELAELAEGLRGATVRFTGKIHKKSVERSSPRIDTSPQHQSRRHKVDTSTHVTRGFEKSDTRVDGITAVVSYVSIHPENVLLSLTLDLMGDNAGWVQVFISEGASEAMATVTESGAVMVASMLDRANPLSSLKILSEATKE